MNGAMPWGFLGGWSRGLFTAAIKRLRLSLPAASWGATHATDRRGRAAGLAAASARGRAGAAHTHPHSLPLPCPLALAPSPLPPLSPSASISRPPWPSATHTLPHPLAGSGVCPTDLASVAAAPKLATSRSHRPWDRKTPDSYTGPTRTSRPHSTLPPQCGRPSRPTRRLPGSSREFGCGRQAASRPAARSSPIWPAGCGIPQGFAGPGPRTVPAYSTRTHRSLPPDPLRSRGQVRDRARPPSESSW